MKTDVIILIILIIVCAFTIYNSYQGQKAVSKLIIDKDPNWEPSGHFWKVLWSLFKPKRKKQ